MEPKTGSIDKLEFVEVVLSSLAAPRGAEGQRTRFPLSVTAFAAPAPPRGSQERLLTADSHNCNLHSEYFAIQVPFFDGVIQYRAKG